MPSGSSSRCRRRPGVLTLARIVATINATIPAAAHEIGSSMTRSSVFTRTVPPSRGCTTLRASSRAVPSWRSARRARSKSISNPITSTFIYHIPFRTRLHAVDRCGTRGQSAYPSTRGRNRNASVTCQQWAAREGDAVPSYLVDTIHRAIGSLQRFAHRHPIRLRARGLPPLGGRGSAAIPGEVSYGYCPRTEWR